MASMLNCSILNTSCDSPNNATASRYLSWPPYQTDADKIISYVGHSTQAIVSLPLHFMLIFLILTDKEFRQGHNFLLLNALVAEALQVIIMTLFAFTQHSIYVICVYGGVLVAAGALVSEITYTFISLNRYISLYHADSLPDIFSSRNIALMVTFTWFHGIGGHVPFLVTGSMGYEEMRSCGFVVRGELWRVVYLLVYFIVTLNSCYAVSTFCNLRIYQKITNHEKQMGEKMKKRTVRDYSGILRMLIIHCLLPLALQFPFAVAKMIPGIENVDYAGRLLTIMYLWIAASSPWIVVLCLKPYREAVANLVQRKTGIRIAQVGPSSVSEPEHRAAPPPPPNPNAADSNERRVTVTSHC